MNTVQKASLKLEERRRELSQLLDVETRGDDFQDKLAVAKKAVEDAQNVLQATGLADDIPTEDRVDETTEGVELRELRERVKVSEYVTASMVGRPVAGAEMEYSMAVGAEGRFPLELLAPPEVRQTTAADAEASAGTWLDRVFAESAATHIGVSMRSVPPGVASFPVTTAGVTAAQRGKSETATAASWTVGVSELKPKRNAVHAIFNIEDAARLGGLEEALRRDLSAALVDGIDKAIFVGDTGASGTASDITGLTHVGIGEGTLAQADKVKGDEILKLFAAMIDGQYAGGVADLRTVLSVGANTLWMGTVLPSPATTGETIAQFLRRAGIDWRVRGGIETNTANGDFGAFVGRSRGIDGAGISAVWEAGDLVRDNFSGASKGEVQLTLSYLWDFAVPRTASYRRIKFTS